MARRCCARRPANDNDGSAMLYPQQRGTNDAVPPRPANDNNGPPMLLAARTGSLPLVDTKNTSYTKLMTDTKNWVPQALMAILSRKNIEITGTLVFEDESASYPDIRSLSVRGAQRELTGWLVSCGYIPAGRWSEESHDDDGFSEWTRAFRPGQDASRIVAGIPRSEPDGRAGAPS
jgi:hypothetical protein